MSEYRPVLTEYRQYLHEMRVELSQRSFGKRYTLRTVVAFCIESGYRRLFPGRKINTARKLAALAADYRSLGVLEMSELLQSIKNELSKIEQEKDVKIVYACESGSRAWGFPSQDSDYDVRFIYIHKPNWYLSISKGRDVIEKPICDSLDISGWELQKALCLFKKSNPPLLEWLGSPIIYHEQFSTVADMRSIAHEYYSQNACAYHYLHMANGNFKDYLRGSEVWVKKYFYVLRPLMAILWMEQGRGLVPTDFTVIVKELDIPQFLRDAINDLIEEKKAGKELRRGPRDEIISPFIETELERLTNNKPAYPRPIAHKSKLDALFIKSLNQVWPGYLGVHLTTTSTLTYSNGGDETAPA